MTPAGELGAVWTMGRPLVYRSLEILERRELIESAGNERGARGPNRTIYRATPTGEEALRAWLTAPVEHVRDVRSLLLLKLVFAERLDVDARPMLAAQHETIAAAVHSLEDRARAVHGSEHILLRFRLESTRAVLRFIEGLLNSTSLTAQAV